MKYLITALALALIGLVGCSLATNVTRGSGNVITESRAVSNFQRVQLSGVGELEIVQGDTESLTIQADDNLMPLIKTTVTNGTLDIGLDTTRGLLALNPAKPIRYTLQVKTLDSIVVSGAGNVSAPSLKGDSLTVRTSGAGNVTIPQIQATTLTTGISGAGNMTLGGEVQTQDATLSGLGNYNAADLKSTNASVSISGAGSARVWATDTLNARLSGAGSVEYYGSPQVRQTVSGLGSIKSLGAK
ncbi:MAG: DUF2807 domain-containing protein [Anaerolineae bacterium]|nr:DUF2807 domain-containing protein [Anaerolineae bacterium]